MMKRTVAIVGAGLAGLTCAKVLRDNGCTDLVVLEKSDRPGGRVRTDALGTKAPNTDSKDRFLLDRGFQVLFEAYPSVQQHLNLEALEVCKYAPGAVLVQGAKHYPIGDPLRAPGTLLPSISNPLLTLLDKARVLALRTNLWHMSIEQIWAQPDLSTIDFLHRWGFSERIIQNFFFPFYGGIFLDADLKTSALLFQFYFKMLSEGAIVTPRKGMGAISDQLASHLSAQQLRCDAPVSRIQVAHDRATGVLMEDSTEVVADWVVCATESPAIAQLLPQSTPEHSEAAIPTTPRAVTCLYFSTPISAHSEAAIHLNSALSDSSTINNCVQLDNVSSDMAPNGQHLLSVTVLGNPKLSTAELAEHCHRELLQWFPHLDGNRLKFLRDYRIPFAQFDQPPGIHDRLPTGVGAIDGLVLAGEYTQQSSIEGSMHSGELAAREILKQLKS
ncbi:MAG: NAD(P)/FAD-dependent oxidoreductase [Cyanobacteria bacterium P01_E01_bin.34]